MQDAALINSMETHLQKCPLSRSHFESIYPGVLTGRLDLNRPLLSQLTTVFAIGVFAIGHLPGY